MEHLFQHIHIFKTNIGNESLPLLSKLFSDIKEIIQWNVDTDDCDRVLRIVSHQLSENEIKSLVSQNGFICEDLN